MVIPRKDVIFGRVLRRIRRLNPLLPFFHDHMRIKQEKTWIFQGSRLVLRQNDSVGPKVKNLRNLKNGARIDMGFFAIIHIFRGCQNPSGRFCKKRPKFFAAKKAQFPAAKILNFKISISRARVDVKFQSNVEKKPILGKFVSLQTDAQKPTFQKQ